MKYLSMFLFSLVIFSTGLAISQTSPSLGGETPQEVVEPVAAPATPSITQIEAEIPVNLEAPKKTVASENPMVKFGLAFGVIGILGCGSFLLLRKYQFKNNKQEKMQIKVLTQHYLGPKKSLAIIRVAGESILIGVTDHNINMIKSLSLLDEDVPEELRDESAVNTKNFNTVFNSVDSKNMNPAVGMSRVTPYSERSAANNTKSDETEDEFSFSGIRDLVSGKLKNMRNI